MKDGLPVDLDPKRVFTDADKGLLYEIQSGDCGFCHRRMLEGLEALAADHFYVAHRNGGRTKLDNGRLMHAACHEIKTRVLDQPHNEPRTWQYRCAAQFLDRWGQQVFTIYAAPGAGKTEGTMRLFDLWRPFHDKPLLIVVSPRQSIADVWNRTALARDYLVGETMDNRRARWHQDVPMKIKQVPRPEVDVWLTTYAALTRTTTQRRMREACRTRDVFVVFDEIHHASSEQEEGWGRASMDAFAEAAKIVPLTGTPWRTDGEAISFVDYTDAGIMKADFTYPWLEALRDKVIVPIEFFYRDSEIGWTELAPLPSDIDPDLELAELSQRTEGSSLISDRKQGRKALRAGLQQEEWVRGEVRKGWLELQRLRNRDDRRLTGILFCDTQADTKDLLDWMNSIPVEDDAYIGKGVLAISDMGPEAHEVIERHATTPVADFIGSVDMISEGTDFPHAAVGIWINNRITPTRAMQTFARVVRAFGGKQRAVFLLPDVWELRRIAGALLSYQETIRINEEEDERGQNGRDGLGPPPSSLRGESFTETVTTRTSVGTVSTPVPDEARLAAQADWAIDRGLSEGDIAAVLENTGGGIPSSSPPATIRRTTTANRDYTLAAQRITRTHQKFIGMYRLSGTDPGRLRNLAYEYAGLYGVENPSPEEADRIIRAMEIVARREFEKPR